MIGFGTYKLNDELPDLIPVAIESGCRLFDTAEFKFNIEKIAEGIKKTGLKREEFKIIYRVCNYKLPPKLHLDEILAKTGLEYFDYLLLYHRDKNDKWVNIYRHIRDYKHKIKCGTANFGIKDLMEFKTNFSCYPDINQFESNPYFQQRDLINFCAENNIKIFTNTILARGRVFQDSRIIELSEKYNSTPSEFLLNFYNNELLNPIFSSKNPEHIRMVFNSEFNGKIKTEDLIEFEKINQPEDNGRVTRQCLINS